MAFTEKVPEPYQKVVGSLCASDGKGINSQYVSQNKCIVEKRKLVRKLIPLEMMKQSVLEEINRLSEICEVINVLPGGVARFKMYIYPDNLKSKATIFVLSEESPSARIYGLMTVLKGITEIEMMCLNSRENFEENKRYLKKRAEEENNPVVRKLLELAAGHLDRMQVQMATAREILLIIRLKDQKESEIFSYLNRIEKMLVEQGFKSKRADDLTEKDGSS